MNGLDIIARRQFEFFCSLKTSLMVRDEKVDQVHRDQKRNHEREMSYLQTLARNLETAAEKLQSEQKQTQAKQLAIELTQKRTALETDQKKYPEMRAALSSYIGRSGMGA